MQHSLVLVVSEGFEPGRWQPMSALLAGLSACHHGGTLFPYSCLLDHLS